MQKSRIMLDDLHAIWIVLALEVAIVETIVTASYHEKLASCHIVQYHDFLASVKYIYNCFENINK